jgi:ribonuclease-3
MERPDDCIPLQEDSNERLEFLGDAILNLVVADYLYERYPDENEGFLTIMRTRLVNGNMLSYLASKIHLGDHIVISKQVEANNGRQNNKILEDAFEALIGAIYIDFNDNANKKHMCAGNGFAIAKVFIINILETYVEFSDLVHQRTNPKDKLIKQCQHNFQWTPKIYEIDVCDKDNTKIHTVCIKNQNNDVIATAKATTRKLAEISAASKALAYFGWDES